MRWKIFQWMKFLFRHSSNSRKLSRQKFQNELACVFTAHFASKNADWNPQQLTDVGILANRNSANHPYCFLSNQKKSRFWLFCMWSVKEMYHASRKQITEIKGEGMITGYTAVLFEIKGSHAQWGDSLSDLETRLLCNSSRSIGTVIASWPVVPVLLWRDFQNQKCGHSKDHYGTIRNQTK